MGHIRQFFALAEEIDNLLSAILWPEGLHPYSIDEAFLDITRSHALLLDPIVARRIQTSHMRAIPVSRSAMGIRDNMLLKAKGALVWLAAYLACSPQAGAWDPMEGGPNLSDFWGISLPRTQGLSLDDWYTFMKQLARVVRNSAPLWSGPRTLSSCQRIGRGLISPPTLPGSQRSAKTSRLGRTGYMEELAPVSPSMADEGGCARLRRPSIGWWLSKPAVEVAFREEIPRTILVAKDTNSGHGHNHKVVREPSTLQRKHYLPQPVRSIGISLSRFLPKTLSQQLSLLRDVEEVQRQEAGVGGWRMGHTRAVWRLQ